MYFVCMKSQINGADAYFLTLEDESLSFIINAARDMQRLLSINSQKSPIRNFEAQQITDNTFNASTMKMALLRMNLGSVNEIEWKFTDRYGRVVRCYITNNI